MTRQPVQSSQITSIGYDPVAKTLEVEFPARGNYPASIYQYFNVPEAEYKKLIEAKSVGGHHAKFIKGAFRFQKVA